MSNEGDQGAKNDEHEPARWVAHRTRITEVGAGPEEDVSRRLQTPGGILLFLLTDAGSQAHTVQIFEAGTSGEATGHVLVYQDPRLFAVCKNDFAVDR